MNDAWCRNITKHLLTKHNKLKKCCSSTVCSPIISRSITMLRSLKQLEISSYHLLIFKTVLELYDSWSVFIIFPTHTYYIYLFLIGWFSKYLKYVHKIFALLFVYGTSPVMQMIWYIRLLLVYICFFNQCDLPAISSFVYLY